MAGLKKKDLCVSGRVASIWYCTHWILINKIEINTETEKELQAPPAPVISTEYDIEEEGESDEENIPEAPLPPVISKQEVKINEHLPQFHKYYVHV